MGSTPRACLPLTRWPVCTSSTRNDLAPKGIQALDHLTGREWTARPELAPKSANDAGILTAGAERGGREVGQVRPHVDVQFSNPAQ